MKVREREQRFESGAALCGASLKTKGVARAKTYKGTELNQPGQIRALLMLFSFDAI